MSLEVVGKMANDLNTCRCCVLITLPTRRIEVWGFSN